MRGSPWCLLISVFFFSAAQRRRGFFMAKRFDNLFPQLIDFGNL
jgi:hypothetical protein